MKRLLILLMLAAVGLMGCNRRGESPLTGAYGSSMISGEVFLTGVSNTSPAGVQVSVRGTGMTATLGANGQFAFANVPEGALLDFQRTADGIEASLRLDASSGFVTVELRQGKATATAKKSGRRRAGARGGEKVYEFEGLIRAAAADSIVVYTSHKQEVTIGLTPDTIIRKGQTLLTAADLTVDTRVHVKARFANDAYSAVLVIVQDDDDDEDDDGTPPAVREYEGRVVSATAQELVVFTSKKQEVKFVLTDETVIRRGSATFNLAQILIGMLVHVKATANADGTNTAVLVIVQNTRVKAEIEGTVASVGASSLVVTTSDGEMSVQVTQSTQIRRSGKKIPLSDVTVGASVEVEGTLVDATTIQAKKITLED
ncbi:MAG: DUF5666 domain-containing protein [Thermoanaerobaculia bacterium]